jgi:hypothetical protein
MERGQISKGDKNSSDEKEEQDIDIGDDSVDGDAKKNAGTNSGIGNH